ncbi:uncharacterized protein G2W53_025990 [Senna tora]|uniref:Uncharacterized protein n=1 Tax=Senna tora TaxID=362788 RepID=A0A834WEP2_9FABA|nr:uncharacterized protein G2W53_025990 [Senna tora]
MNKVVNMGIIVCLSCSQISEFTILPIPKGCNDGLGKAAGDASGNELLGEEGHGLQCPIQEHALLSILFAPVCHFSTSKIKEREKEEGS